MFAHISPNELGLSDWVAGYISLSGSAMSTDWFRNTTWDEVIELGFNVKLKRAKNKAQYLRIQALTLTASHPGIALTLLDRYFALDDRFDHAMAHVHRAEAYLALGRINDAVRSYEEALTREAEFPNLRTRAYIDLPCLIATRGIQNRYERANELLETHEDRLMFPVDHFRWNAARALIAVEGQDIESAKRYARRALDAAASAHSGFRYHPTVGLVTERYDNLIRRLEEFCATQQGI
jgi:tetratricopeptide (TPR) repeat protein